MNEYILENCSVYEYLQIKGKDVYIFDSHNMALPVWGTYSNRMNTAFTLVTFDSHTDTRPPFTAEIIANSYDNNIRISHPIVKEILKGKKYKRDAFLFEDVFKIAYQNLQNDEHIQTAEFFEYIKSYHVICDLDDLEARVYESDDCVRGYDAKYHIRKNISKLDFNNIESPIILDFDLDYFIWDGCFNDSFKRVITPLVKKATVITIAREQEFFDKCKIENDYSYENALEKLLSIIEAILNDSEGE